MPRRPDHPTRREGNLAFFHAGYRWSRGLIRLGRLDGGPAPLLVRGEHALRAERPT
jgi:hypothetical protein